MHVFRITVSIGRFYCQFDHIPVLMVIIGIGPFGNIILWGDWTDVNLVGGCEGMNPFEMDRLTADSDIIGT